MTCPLGFLDCDGRNCDWIECDHNDIALLFRLVDVASAAFANYTDDDEDDDR